MKFLQGRRTREAAGIMKIVDYLRSCAVASLQKIGLPPHETPQPTGGSPLVDRRRETRSPRISPCIYSLMRSFTPGLGLLEEGGGTAVDNSPGGMRLLLDVAPVQGQILEVHIGDVLYGPVA